MQPSDNSKEECTLHPRKEVPMVYCRVRGHLVGEEKTRLGGEEVVEEHVMHSITGNILSSQLLPF